MDIEKHSEIYSNSFNKYIYNLIPRNKKILEVGCNTGNLGYSLIKNKSCKVYGLDYSKKAINIAKKRLTKAIVFDLETYSIPYKNETFDIIIFADVLEHIRYPEKTITDYKKTLKKDGIIIASIPNVANINIRWNLFWGNWNYKEWGILDKTHMRFFTKKTIKQLFNDQNYKIIKITSTPGANFIFLRHFKPLIKIKEIICKIYPKLLALQFIVIAKNKR
jgi:2-polyprenyl-3-methyl-5-hydroxy-6-metoxy-1,4-benzoquinol methylase